MEKIDQILENPRTRILLFIAASMLVVAPTFFFGVFDGPDIPQHFQFANTFEQAIRSGDLYPAWAANENLGYGSLGPRFYPPLFSFVLALAHILMGNWHLAICLVFLIFTFVGAVGSYLLAKEFLQPHQAFWAGAIFGLMPYHLVQIYGISVYAEFAGCSALPFCFLFVTRVCKRGTARDVIGLACSYAALILIHLPSSITGSICLLIYALVMISRAKIWATLSKLAIGASLGLLASSAYWLKMVTELSWLQHTKFHNERVFDYSYNFLIAANFFDGGPYPFLTAVFIVTILMAGLSIWGLYTSKEFDLLTRLRGAIILFTVSVFMALPISQPVWELFPFIQAIQFPFRWLTITTVSGSIIVASAIHPLYSYAMRSPDNMRYMKLATGVLAMGFVFVLNLTWMSGWAALPTSNFDQWVDNKISSQGLDFWWTAIAKKEAFDTKERVVSNNRKPTITDWQPYERDFTVEPGNPGYARIATFFYPRWQAEVNGKAATVLPDENGAIIIQLPQERSIVRLQFQESPPVKIAIAFSIITWLLMTFALTFTWINNEFKMRRSVANLAANEISC